MGRPQRERVKLKAWTKDNQLGEGILKAGMEQFLEEVLNSIIYQWWGWGEELGANIRIYS